MIFAGKTDDMFNKRLKFNQKIMGQGRQSSDNKKTYKERFVPPELSMITYFMTKPFVECLETDFCYNSDDSLSSDEEYESDEDNDEIPNRPTSL